MRILASQWHPEAICRDVENPVSSTEAEGFEPPRVVNPPHFECGALPIRATPPDEREGETSRTLRPRLDHQSGRWIRRQPSPQNKCSGG